MDRYTIVTLPGDPRCLVRVLFANGGYEETGYFRNAAEAEAFRKHEYPCAVKLTEGEMMCAVERAEVLV